MTVVIALTLIVCAWFLKTIADSINRLHATLDARPSPFIRHDKDAATDVDAVTEACRGIFQASIAERAQFRVLRQILLQRGVFTDEEWRRRIEDERVECDRLVSSIIDGTNQDEAAIRKMLSGYPGTIWLGR